MQESIERIRPDQAELLRELRLEALLDAPEAFGRRHDEIAARPMQYWQEHAQKYAESEDSVTFILYRQGKPAGMIGAFLEGHRRDHAFICSMWVAPQYRRGGAGGRLVDTASRWLSELGAELIQAWIAEHNQRAVRFYETLGFVRTDQQRESHGLSEILLTFDTALL